MSIGMAAEFTGKIALDIRDSEPDWGPYEAPKAPENAPNVLYVVWDDVGIATWDCFGGLVDMPAMTRIAERGVRLTGTDGWSWDAPFVHTREAYEATGNAGLIWEGHKAGRDIGYCHLEKLHNLEVLPPTGFTIACFPMKIRAASAGWTSAVAIFED
jgi:kynurenine formamidase